MKRLLKTRISEHNRINRHSNQHSIISEHRLEFNYDFYWNNVKILDEEKNYNKRLISVYLY